MMKWTRAKIEENFPDNLRDVFTGWGKHIYKGSPISFEIYRSQCIHYLEIINQLLIENNLQNKIDFESIVKGSVWTKKTENPETATMLGFLSVHKCYLSYLESLYEKILSGNIPDDYKFPKLPKTLTKKFYSFKEAITLTNRCRRTIEIAVDNGELIAIDKIKGRGREIERESLKKYLKKIKK